MSMPGTTTTATRPMTSAPGRRRLFSMAASPISTSGPTRSAAAFRSSNESHVRIVSSGADFPPLDAALHFAIGLVHVRAVVEVAPFRGLLELGKRLAQPFGGDVPQPQLAKAGRVDREGFVAEVDEGGW